ncbi:Branched-chain amino acid transport protein [Andreprevotia lacus DSM 23236]|jgi:branched-subunit amino acid transport protein|uniref:Branched-chain amino acid transport protein n=1 Tax=Andreprevotia lacus DSM 23236 TaxID=1121001 RepID=A0A1W1Y1Z3_9NEIS|nr:AzlD domain-containing protein [Andreprevotia lacus]SMC29778.1 Branched-chain amino acid transport protein [Andreprevotia lacus DSM 23236]
MSMATSDILLTLAGMALVTYGPRVALWLGNGGGFPPRLRRMLEYVPVAVLSAIVFPIALLHDDKLYLSIHNAYLAGAVAAGLIVWRSKHLLAGIGGGLIVYVAWRLLLS